MKGRKKIELSSLKISHLQTCNDKQLWKCLQPFLIWHFIFVMCTLCVKVFYCSYCYQQDIAVNKTWQWSKPSFRNSFIDWQVLFYVQQNTYKQTANYKEGHLECWVFTLHYSRSHQVPWKEDREPALCTWGTKWLQGLFLPGNVADCMQEIQEATGVLTQPAVLVLWRGAVPRSVFPLNILNEQTQVCPMIPAAEKGTCSSVTWSKANFSPVIKSQTLFQEMFSHECPAFQAIQQNLK